MLLTSHIYCLFELWFFQYFDKRIENIILMLVNEFTRLYSGFEWRNGHIFLFHVNDSTFTV